MKLLTKFKNSEPESCGRLARVLTGCQTGWLAGWLAGWLTGWLAHLGARTGQVPYIS